MEHPPATANRCPEFIALSRYSDTFDASYAARTGTPARAVADPACWSSPNADVREGLGGVALSEVVLTGGDPGTTITTCIPLWSLGGVLPWDDVTP
jgi:hypothetical protein